MESSALGADVGLSLIHLLGDTESVLRERNAQVGGARAARMRALSAVWLSVPGGSGCFKGVLLRGRIAAQRTALEHYAITRVPAFGLPPTPAEGKNGIKPYGLVDAAAITSRTSIFILSQNSAISLTPQSPNSRFQ